MPVLFDSSAKNFGYLAAGAGNVQVEHTVNPLATNTVAVVAALWFGVQDSSSGTLAATFGGEAMTRAKSTPLYWNGNHDALQVFTLDAPPSGDQEVIVTGAGLGSNGGWLVIESVTLSGVGSIGTIVTVDGSGSGTANTITASSVAAAYRVVTIHGCGDLESANNFTAFTGTKRADYQLVQWPFVVGELLIGDTAGAASVVATATMQGAGALWGAFAIPMTPAIVQGNASLNMSLTESANGGIYRVATPSPERTWVIES